MDIAILENIVNSSQEVEAAIHISNDGLPLAWRCKEDAPVEEIASIAAGLFSFGLELDLVSDKSSANLSIETSHGSLVVKELPDTTLLLIVSSRNYSLQTLELKLNEILIPL